MRDELIAIYYCTLNKQLVLRRPIYGLVKFGCGLARGATYPNVRKTMTFIGYL